MHSLGTCLLLAALTLSPCPQAHPTTRQISGATGAQVATVLHTRVRELLHQYEEEQLQGISLKGSHSLPSLPVLLGRASELESVQAERSLPKIQRSLRIYEFHLTWLRGTRLMAQSRLINKITEVLKLLQNLAHRVETEMLRMNLPWDAFIPMSLTEGKEWSTLKAGFIILRDLQSFLRKTTHELRALSPEW